MIIRLMTKDDYNAVYDLWANTEGIGLSTVNDTYEGICAYLSRNPSTCFVATEDGAVVGVILSGHDGRRGFIYHTAVSSDYRSRGIGSALVGASIDAMKREGITKAALVVFQTNEVGNTFWDKRGFIKRDDLIYRNLSLDG